MENMVATITAVTGTAAEYPNATAAIAPNTKPTTIPNIPPIRHSMTDSIINCSLMELFFAPRAFLVPISLVLSVIDIMYQD